MNEPFDSLTEMLSDVILPNLKAVHVSQAEQIAANDRLELAMNELRTQINLQFAQLTAQLTACRAEVAAVHELLKAARAQAEARKQDRNTLVH
jgi:hypothetical protein